jgi:methyl-accepting chemotaxis protein
MTVTEVADEVQSQLLSLVQIAQENVVDAIERVSERAQNLLPASATHFASRLPNAAQLADRGFETTEQWLRSQRQFVAKLGDALTPPV